MRRVHYTASPSRRAALTQSPLVRPRLSKNSESPLLELPPDLRGLFFGEGPFLGDGLFLGEGLAFDFALGESLGAFFGERFAFMALCTFMGAGEPPGDICTLRFLALEEVGVDDIRPLSRCGLGGLFGDPCAGLELLPLCFLGVAFLGLGLAATSSGKSIPGASCPRSVALVGETTRLRAETANFTKRTGKGSGLRDATH